MMRRIGFVFMGSIAAAALALATGALVTGSTAVADQVNTAGPDFTRATIPPGFTQIMLLIANGEVPEADGVALDGNIFQQQIMGRTPAQIAARRAMAEQFFEDRYGILNAQTNPDVAFDSIFIDPRVNYRLYILGGEKVPQEGWEVRDGGFIITVVNPNGIVLGGDYAGVHVPPGTVMGTGEYNIKRTKPNGQLLAPLIMEWRSIPPILPNPIPGETYVPVLCEITSNDFGTGVALGFSDFHPANGVISTTIRNVTTFSPDGGF